MQNGFEVAHRNTVEKIIHSVKTPAEKLLITKNVEIATKIVFCQF